MEEAEPPECPVCLQPYDAASVIPRVLSCGHTTCEACLKQLPNPFPNTLRCTVCTLLIKFGNCPTSLPKNLDLLHISSVLQHHPSGGNKEDSRSSTRGENENLSLAMRLIPKPWTYEFYRKWKRWVLPEGSVMIGQKGVEDDCDMRCGKFLKSFGSDHVMGDAVRENEKLGLVKVGIFMEDESPTAHFKHSYESRIMSVLHKMRENERIELGSILHLNFSNCNVGKVYGFWYDEKDNCMYIVFEKFESCDLLDNMIKKEAGERLSIDEMRVFGMLGMELCEILSCLHLEGLAIGCLSLCFLGFNKFDRVFVDIAAVLNMGRRLNTIIRWGHENSGMSSKASKLDENLVFLSPETMLQFLKKRGFDLDCGESECGVSGASDVWAIASLLVRLIVGSPFLEEMRTYVHSVATAITDKKEFDYSGLYLIWFEKVVVLLEGRLGLERSVKDVLRRCLEFDPESRPIITELWKFLRELVIQVPYDKGITLKSGMKKAKLGYSVVLGELCQIVEKTNEKLIGVRGDSEREQVDQTGVMNGDVGDGVSKGRVKCVEMKGHFDCITGLTIGGGFLFSSSYDKMVCVWSLKDFTHVHSFKGHDHRVMAVCFVDGTKPLCISGDNEGVLCIWEANFPFNDLPIKKLREQKDWRYSGIHALAVSGTEYLYTGGGDKLIKAWSLQDYTLLCSMSGHKSVVSSLVVCDGVLYSGSWDGMVRLWSLSDHTSLAVLGEDKLGKVASITSLSAEHHLLFVGHENGCLKVWHNNVLLQSTQPHNGSVFSVRKKGKWLFSGGWDKKIYVQEVSEDGEGMSSIPVGTIACDSVVIALMYWEGNLFVGQADKTIKVLL
ncbi:hypothetical protein F511_06255 [Dorcoceras hygrometricum]|uniref:Uncharacterized protein n=1 Tax=Dorcoceras hygrometricum TaxID=472368 RepID=A0A2Z7B374_9LAMI|nr:hypothetical protein F511_06255 [Dorcoceras hygrometricum]